MALLISGLMNFLKLPSAKVRSFYLNINTRLVMHEVLGQMNKQESSGLLNLHSLVAMAMLHKREYLRKT